VEIFFSDELRLVYALLLQAAILVGAWQFIARRVATGWADRAADVLLVSLLVQYVAVALPGALGVLNPLTIAATTLLCAAALFLAPPRGAGWASALSRPWRRAKDAQRQPRLPVPPGMPAVDHYTVLAASLFAVGYMVGIGYTYRYMPVVANDALTYHFPAAVQWLRTGRLSLFETWLFNPANTYSPLAGSTFITWWIAPIGNDVLAHNEQFPALLLIFFAALRLTRALGIRTAIAAVIALALVLSRPVLRQAIIEKDDLYLAAFFGCVVAACAPDRLRDPLGPWRVGVALGLMLATKYSALLALPALLLLADAPLRARWRPRAYGAALAALLVVAGPWYLRNLLLTGNPLFPIRVQLFGVTLLPGLFSSGRSAKFSSSPIISLLTGSDQGLPPALLIALSLGVAAAIAGSFRRLRFDPLARVCLLGPFIAFVVFVTTCPYPEVRYLLPAIVLLFAATAVGITRWLRRPVIQGLAASIVVVICWATTWPASSFAVVAPDLMMTAATVTIAGACVAWGWRRARSRPPAVLAGVPIICSLVLAATIYVMWSAYVAACRHSVIDCYRSQYGTATADAWKFVREELPPDELLAYANTYFIYPMEGFDHARRLIYIPTRRGVTHVRDLPRIPGKPSGEALMTAVADALNSQTDQAAWLARLSNSHATHLIVFKHDVVDAPAELAITRANPDRFKVVFENDDAVVYGIRG
jgi:4-amino-4-deoxy-L-arabinose transferase-like glycosyltransferase